MRVLSSLTSTAKLVRFSACPVLLKVSCLRWVQLVFHQSLASGIVSVPSSLTL